MITLGARTGLAPDFEQGHEVSIPDTRQLAQFIHLRVTGEPFAVLDG